MKILITGASGFIGSFIAEQALREGMDVWAGARASSSHRYLQDPRIHFVTLDFSDERQLYDSFKSALAEHGGWDVIVHAAGITKSLYRHDFFAVNYDGTRRMVSALKNAGAVPGQFIYLSSLSVLGPIREQAFPLHDADDPFGSDGSSLELRKVIYQPLLESDMPVPNTAYGLSKAAAENYLHMMGDFPWVIFRPTGVYGPREKDYYMLARSISRHVDFAVGFRPQEITFIYVRDLVSAIMAAVKRGVTHRTYALSDGRVYNSRAFSILLQRAMGVSGVVRIKAPLWLLCGVCSISELISHISGKVTALNKDKYRILRQRNWQCDISAAVEELGWKPQYDLRRGVEETVEWYKTEHWL